MQITILPHAAGSDTVTVVFVHQGVTHEREVNICRNGQGSYDKDGTAKRVEEVARGVAYKIEANVITNPAPEPADD